MGDSAFIGRFFDPPRDPGGLARGARVRRMLLEQVRYALTTEPAAVEPLPDLPADSVTYIRGRISITVGAIVVRLNREGFTESDRLYEMRDGLAQGKPVERTHLEWLNTIIARERSRSAGVSS
jgi:hypothetical protein